MRTYEEYKRILELWEAGHNKSQISRMTGIPRPTVRDAIKRYGSLKGLEENRARASKSTADIVLERIRKNTEMRKTYAYLLGMYLGDGCLTKPPQHRVYLLRVALDDDYPNIIQRCTNAIKAVLPNNSVFHVAEGGRVNVSCYYKHWPEVFPQHGEGLKHKRDIILEDWQQSIIDEYPLEFLRGLYESDGCRAHNIVKGKDYPRYQFSNTSVDILKLYSDTCNKLGIHWTTKGEKRTRINNLIYISRRKDVEYLDTVFGPKS